MSRKVLLEATGETLTIPCKITLTPQLIEQLAAEVKKGLPLDGACDLLGIQPRNFQSWIQRGEAYLQSDHPPEEEQLFGLFAQALRKASAEYRQWRLEVLHQPRNKNWYRELAILERRDRKSFGRKEPAGGTREDFVADDRFL